MDLLSAFFDTVRLRSWVHGRNVYTAPWGLRVPASDEEVPEAARVPAAAWPVGRGGRPVPRTAPEVSFFAITGGECWIEVEGAGPARKIAGGDVLLLTRGRAFTLRDDPETAVRPVWEVVSEENFERRGGGRYGGGGDATTFVVGGFLFDDHEPRRLLAALPPLIHVGAGDAKRAAWLDGVVAALEQETGAYAAGSQVILNHLAQVLFVEAVRWHVSRDGAADGNFLGALLDAEIGPALGQIHAKPEAPWTVASLAEAVAMSRSAFAERFAKLTGATPLHYLTEYRMQRAAEMLRGGQAGMKEIATKVGYESEAAFSNAFKRLYGVAPAGYRKAQRAGSG